MSAVTGFTSRWSTPASYKLTQALSSGEFSRMIGLRAGRLNVGNAYGNNSYWCPEGTARCGPVVSRKLVNTVQSYGKLSRKRTIDPTAVAAYYRYI